jgi:hypothetical protein
VVQKRGYRVLSFYPNFIKIESEPKLDAVWSKFGVDDRRSNAGCSRLNTETTPTDSHHFRYATLRFGRAFLHQRAALIVRAGRLLLSPTAPLIAC